MGRSCGWGLGLGLGLSSFVVAPGRVMEVYVCTICCSCFCQGRHKVSCLRVAWICVFTHGAWWYYSTCDKNCESVDGNWKVEVGANGIRRIGLSCNQNLDAAKSFEAHPSRPKRCRCFCCVSLEPGVSILTSQFGMLAVTKSNNHWSRPS